MFNANHLNAEDSNFPAKTKTPRTLLKDQIGDSYLFKCLVCSESFDSNENFELHECKQTEGNVYSCNLCQESFSSSFNYILHNLVHTGGSLYQCEKCNGLFTDQLEFEKHVDAHNRENIGNFAGNDKEDNTCFHVSDLCETQFGKGNDLSHDIKIHAVEESSWFENLMKSLAISLNSEGTKLNDKGNPELIEKGNDLSSQKSSVAKIHTRDNPYNCGYCEKSFNQYLTFTHHLKSHNEEKSYKNKECDESYVNSSSLTRDKKIHSVEKTQKPEDELEDCRKLFLQKCSVKNHTELQSIEQAFICDYCERSFTRKSNLTNHRKVHIGEKPFECEYSEKLFSKYSYIYNIL